MMDIERMNTIVKHRKREYIKTKDKWNVQYVENKVIVF